MAEFVMPALGADMQAGTLTEWLKKPGDAVTRGEIVAVVHTDKADVEVEVFTSGVLERVLVEPGTEVPVGTVLAVIRENGAVETPVSEQPPAPRAEPAAAPPPAGADETHPAHPHVAVSPSARHLADELGVDLAGVQGSGPNGRIQRKDVEAAATGAPPNRASPAAAATTSAAAAATASRPGLHARRPARVHTCRCRRAGAT